MPIITIDILKVKRFISKIISKFNMLNPSSSDKKKTPSVRREPSQCLPVSLIQSAEAPLPGNPPLWLWKTPAGMDRFPLFLISKLFWPSHKARPGREEG